MLTCTLRFTTHSTTCIHDTLDANLYPALHDTLHDVVHDTLFSRMYTHDMHPRHVCLSIPRQHSTTHYLSTTPFHDTYIVFHITTTLHDMFSTTTHHDAYPRMHTTTTIHDSHKIKPCRSRWHPTTWGVVVRWCRGKFWACRGVTMSWGTSKVSWGTLGLPM